jgi:hypothetical protein
MANLRLQSAMEYLMTYGWAILIIAVVLVALFALGIFGGSPLATTCIPSSGFQCTGVTFNRGIIGNYPAGNVVFTVGQSTGVNWIIANVFYVPDGTALIGGVPSTIPASGLTTNLVTEGSGNVIVGGLASGQTAQVSLGVNNTAGTTILAGTSETGSVWVQFWINSIGGLSAPYYVQVAKMTLKAA